MNRRSFLATAVSFAAYSFFIPRKRALRWFNRFRHIDFLGEDELEIAVCAAEYVYPEDDSAGAKMLGIRDFFRRQLRFNHNTHYLEAVREVCAIIQKHSKHHFSRPFLDLQLIEQQLLLANVFEDNLPQNAERLNMFINFTLEGCFCDPSHGGNRSFKGWEIMGEHLKREWFDV